MGENRRIWLLLLFGCLACAGWSQTSSYRERSISADTDSLVLDTLTIYPGSLDVFCGNQLLPTGDYHLDIQTGTLYMDRKCRESDSLHIRYRVLPFNLHQKVARRDTSQVYERYKGDRERFMITNSSSNADIFGGSSLNKSGSISRGITFGNSQDLGVNSSLNLELSGDIAPNLKLLASVSDDNLPIQPEGNTNKLQEFDQIYIKIYNDRLQLIAGDFWLRKPKGYFMTYTKRAQGLSINYRWSADTSSYWTTQVSGALSKGKFQRQIIQGVEGNQGPYKLTGADNEPFIIVLSGTEQVFIDGRLLERGQEYDYIINYNTSELIFTSRNQITKDSRIVVEFQYSDQSYARSLLQTSNIYTSRKLTYWLNGYAEQDAKNQPLQQSLSLAEKMQLSTIGDSLELARVSSIDSVGFAENQLLYRITDSLGYDSVLVFSVDPAQAIFRASFQYVGSGNGDYVLDNYNALGKVFRWVAPVNGVRQGDHEPSRLINTPKKRQMVTTGASYKLTGKLTLETELAYTKNDQNTFSTLDSADDDGYGGYTRLIGLVPLSRDSIPRWTLEAKGELEMRDRNFSPIQQYRAVEFDRDWNIRGKPYTGNQVFAIGGANFKNARYGNLNIEAQQFTFGNDFRGYKALTNGRWSQKGFSAVWEGFALKSRSTEENVFVRHRAELSQALGKYLRVGYKDDHEYNVFSNAQVPMLTNSYQFFDYQFYLANGDSISNQFKLFYRERYDQRSDSSALLPAAKATTVGGEMTLSQLRNQRLTIITSYRRLAIRDSTLLNQAPENTLTGRIDYELKLFRNALSWNSFYEIGSGLELRKEFLYIKVNDGQGIYTWIDYNGDGIKDLNEFEVAQYVDQASYIRVFTPSNTYVRTFSNEFNQSIFWRPDRLWASKKGILRFMSRFSDQFRVRLSRKTNFFDGISSFNPFVQEIRDTSLLATASNIRNTFFFNRTSTVFGAEYSYQDSRGKTLLANGFDSKQNTFHEVSARLNLRRKFTLESTWQTGIKISNADYTTGRNYELNYYFIKPSFIYQPNTVFRISLDGRYSEKNNVEELGGERAIARELGSTLKYNQAEKGSFQAGMSVIQLDYDGEQNSALGFEMLEALKPGINFTWNLSYQRSISKNLQLSIQYNGRKSEQNRPIHSAGMEVRAFF